jgi:hypothetical protein
MDVVDIHAHAGSGFRRHLRCRTRDPSCTQVLKANQETCGDQLEACLDQELLGERVSDLNRWTLLGRRLVELGRSEHARTADPIAPGRRTDEYREVAGPFGAPVH